MPGTVSTKHLRPGQIVGAAHRRPCPSAHGGIEGKPVRAVNPGPWNSIVMGSTAPTLASINALHQSYVGIGNEEMAGVKGIKRHVIGGRHFQPSRNPSL